MSRSVSDVRTGDPALIAPCGLNCSVCRAHLRERNRCPGCRIDDAGKAKSCVTCAIKTCPARAASGDDSCGTCPKLPCALMKRLEKRYSTKYNTSPIANLERIRDVGVERFAAEDAERWRCPACNNILCMHRSTCDVCGYQCSR